MNVRGYPTNCCCVVEKCQRSKVRADIPVAYLQKGTETQTNMECNQVAQSSSFEHTTSPTLVYRNISTVSECSFDKDDRKEKVVSADVSLNKRRKTERAIFSKRNCIHSIICGPAGQ